MQNLFQSIREGSGARIWSRGVELARAGSVVMVSRSDDEIVLNVSVPDRRVCPTVTLWPEDEDWGCDCGSGEDPCIHVAAAVIALRRETVGDGRPKPAAPVAARVGYRLTRSERGLMLRRVLVTPQQERTLETALASQKPGQAGPKVAASKQDLAVELALGSYLRGGWIAAPVLGRALAALRDHPDVRLDDHPIKVGPEQTTLRAMLTDDGPGFRLKVVEDAGDAERFANGALRAGDTLHPLADLPLSAAELATLQDGRYYAPIDAGRLVSEVLPRLEAQMPVWVRTRRLPTTAVTPPRLQIDLSREDDRLAVLPTLVYGRPAIARVSGGKMTMLRRDSPVPLRDTEAEARLARRLQQELGLRVGQRHQRAGEEALSFVARLFTLSDVEVSGDAHHAFYLRAPLEARLHTRDDRFDLYFETTDANDAAVPGTVDAARVLRAWRSGESVVPLTGGGFAPLPHQWLEAHGHRVAALLAMRVDNAGTLQPWALPELARLCHDLDHAAPPKLERLRALIDDISGVPAATLPPDLDAQLRTYQRRGVDWLCWLRDAGMGALLADDMGLGKTLQALCAIRGRTLVVSPTSVLPNWEAELARFRPALSCSRYHGADRALDAATDVTLTTYAILRLDAERLADQAWDTVVLDESQTIRNPQSQGAQAAFCLRARWRLALTGTPVENRLDDLWSQFHFLNPGLLGSFSDFAERYGCRVADSDASATQRLRERVRPFILRRLKHDVAAQLPPRTEMILHCQLSASEHAVYEAVHAATRKDVLRQLELGKNVMSALTALLRLRQAACHSGLVPGQQADTSSKLQLLVDVLEQVTAEGHKSLVFSQWTTLLDFAEPMLRAANIDFVRLDGTTRDRQAVVERFQREDGPPAMLISLKAGGIGLNLTEADHVFLLDPWWNPATEQQAADRAHRIGQTKPVLIHKLVAENTIEGRILELQQHKRRLAFAAIEDSGEIASLSRDDLLTLLS